MCVWWGEAAFVLILIFEEREVEEGADFRPGVSENQRVCLSLARVKVSFQLKPPSTAAVSMLSGKPELVSLMHQRDEVGRVST